MKGLTVQSGVEVRIEVTGESWDQGSSVKAVVSSKNGSPVQLSLASGIERKIKSKALDAFEVIEQVSSSMPPLHHAFSLPLDARITDKAGSLYLRYGLAGNPNSVPVRLQIEPHPHLTDLAKIIVTEFRFSLKSVSMGKHHSVEFKLEPPQAKEWTTLETLIVNCKMSPEWLDANFIFHRKEFDTSSSSLKTKTTQGNIKRSLDLKKLVHSFNQKLNADLCVEVLNSIFNEYRSQSWLPA
jgi:hypothetical protein